MSAVSLCMKIKMNILCTVLTLRIFMNQLFQMQKSNNFTIFDQRKACMPGGLCDVCGFVVHHKVLCRDHTSARPCPCLCKFIRSFLGSQLHTTEIPLKKLIFLAGFYHTSTDYLLGITDQREPYPDNGK